MSENRNKKHKIIVLTGPTAVGKTELSIKLAKQVDGEIISADSMQVYKDMNIGSAKIMPDKMQGITHYLIDILDPREAFDVTVFQALAKEALQKIWANGKIPIVVGGTGFYIQALLYDITFTQNDDTDQQVRQKYEALLEENGMEHLHNLLEQVDPESALQIHRNNAKRVIRALEYYELTGEKISVHNEKERKKTSPYQFYYFVVTDRRELLYERIDRRVDIMLQDGLVKEVIRLKEMGLTKEMVSMQGLGYKEILAYLDGEYDLDRAIYLIKRDTRHFAKRQLTWFRRERDVIWIDKSNYQNDDEILNAILTKLDLRL